MEGKFYIFMVIAISVTILFALLIWIQTYIFQIKATKAKKKYEKFLKELAIEKAQNKCNTTVADTGKSTRED